MLFVKNFDVFVYCEFFYPNTVESAMFCNFQFWCGQPENTTHSPSLEILGNDTGIIG